MYFYYMRRRNDQVYIQDIFESISAILTYVGNVSEHEYCTNMMMQDAVNRRFEIIGEAAKNLTEEYKLKNPQIEWQLIKAMRNKLAHEYFGISNSTVYKTVLMDLPILKEKNEALLH